MTTYARSLINKWTIKIVDNQKSKFEITTEFESTNKFLTSFFDIMQDDKSFKKEVIQMMRTK